MQRRAEPAPPPAGSRHLAARTALVAAAVLTALAGHPFRAAAQNVPPRTFVGTWVGVQTWAIDTPSPGAEQPQAVAITIELVDGVLRGTVVPFLGGDDGAAFDHAEIVGDELRAVAVMGRPVSPESDTPVRRNAPRDWKSAVTVALTLKRAGDVGMTGTADVVMGTVEWLTFDFDLARKRARYGGQAQ